MIAKLSACAFGVTIVAQPLANEDFLEPSVRNEVVHALARAPTNAPVATELPLATNGLTLTAIAVRLVSAQRADGRWQKGTNDVTSAVVRVLNGMTGGRDE